MVNVILQLYQKFYMNNCRTPQTCSSVILFVFQKSLHPKPQVGTYWAPLTFSLQTWNGILAFLKSLLMIICSWRKVDLLDQSMLGVRRNEVRVNETSQTLGGSNCKQPRSGCFLINLNLGRESLWGQGLGREIEKLGFSSFSLWRQKLT